MQRLIIHTILFVLSLFLPNEANGQCIIPVPQETLNREGYFSIDSSNLSVYANDTTIVPKEFLLQDVIPNANLIVTSDSTHANILFIKDDSINGESYRLEVTKKRIVINATEKRGAVYALQTLRQLQNREGYKCILINDTPLMQWRGFMLDSGRQYQRVATIKKYIDMASLLKMNIFHWHLTEGLGWRIEIKKYPQLTAKGAFVANGKEQQGYYTQEEIREIVRYAEERGIIVMPEIDMPGHAEAAITSYPSLSCFGKPATIPETGFTQDIFCAGKESTIEFLKDVLDEVCSLFPSAYIHLGGDEAPKNNWDRCHDCQKRIETEQLTDSHDLQRWFAAQMAEHIGKKGRKAIFWEDVLYGDGYTLPDNTIIQWWNYRTQGDKALHTAAKKNIPVICSSNYYTYLNFPVTPWRNYKANRTFGLEECYKENPSYKAYTAEMAQAIGMTAALWTDDGVTEELIDRRLFPRILALAQQMWYCGKPLPFDDFLRIIADKKTWFTQNGYTFGPADRKEAEESYNRE